MTQAFNLAQLANNLNSSGQLDATDGLTGVLPIANGGTGSTAGAVLLTGSTMTGALEVPGYLRITQVPGAQRLLIGNQDSGGTNKPAIIQGANAAIQFGYGDTWSGNGGAMVETFRFDSNGDQYAVVAGGGTVLYRQFTARAWVNFAGGTRSIRASGNVSSVSDAGTGNSVVNFSNNMPDTNYAVIVSKGNYLNDVISELHRSASATSYRAVNQTRVIYGINYSGGTSAENQDSIYVAIFR